MSVEYTAESIQILEGLEAVRKRPGMYARNTSVEGLHHLVYEIVDNAVDEALMDECDHITVRIHPDNSVSVRDNGRGIPVGIQAQRGLPAVEVIFTVLHAGGKFGQGGYKTSGGLHGVGASVVNALSEWLIVQVHKDGKLYEQKFARGPKVTELTIIGDTDEHGTFVHFKPDPIIFAELEDLEYNFETLKQRFREIAYLMKGLTIEIIDERVEPHQARSYCYEGGIKEYISFINQNRTPVSDEIFYCEAKHENVLVEIAIQYNDGFNENTYSFVNNINTYDGGTHTTGFRSSLTKTLNDYGRKFNHLKEKDRNLTGEDVREGITAVISIKLEDPQFDSQGKAKLNNSEARTAVESVLGEQLSFFLEENPAAGKAILDKCIISARARDAARKARDDIRIKSPLDSGRLPGKLTDCSEKDPAKREIFIVEGDSAGGSAKNARTPKTQAILPLRGKIMNVEKARLANILANREITAMITAFGTGIHDEFDINKLRYHKIVLMTDADVDGSHIRTLLLTFIYRYMPDLIAEGFIYIAQPPLFQIEKGKKKYYAYKEDERDSILDEIGREGNITIQRYKGLGEMNAEQLWDTTMDPERRTLLQVKLDDAIAADIIFTQLMGDKVEPRREFIEEHALKVRNLDY